MKFLVPCTALGLAAVAIAPCAHAQAVTAPQPAVAVPGPATTVVTPPERIVRTVTSERAEHPVARHRVAATRRISVRDRVLPSTATVTTMTVAPTVAAAPPAPAYDYGASAPAYNYGAPAPVYDYGASAPAPYYSDPDYDTVVQTPAPIVPAPAVVPAAPVPAAGVVPVGTTVPFYQYVYESDRILVIDPNTGIAVQALPR
jgi:hypothetical protein